MRTVVIASGKGGTGKTTLTALFSRLAAGSDRVVLVDADVEASNLPLALSVEASSCESFTGGGNAWIDPLVCSGCSACEFVCRFGALSFSMETGVFTVDPWACERCGFCVYVCPMDAVRMVDTTVGEACVGTSPVGPLAYGRLEPGQDLSGRLVSEVRRLGSSEAQEQGLSLVIVDGPPGIGCPVVASIADTDLLVAVTEPTVSGEHDLARIVELARRFDLPVRVILNKSDLSAAGARRIREYCRLGELQLIAEIPYDPAFGEYASSANARTVVGGTAIAEATLAWRRIESDIAAIRDRTQR